VLPQYEMKKKSAVLLCPVCGTRLNPNRGWAAQFYVGYCNKCDLPIEKKKETKNGKENAQIKHKQ